MALLKDLIVTGASRFIGDAYMNTIKSGTWNGTAIDLSHGGTAGTTTANKLLLSTTTSGTSVWSNWSTGGFLKTNTSGVISIDSNSYKTTLTAVSDPSADGTSLTFIATLSQNTNGVISLTKKTVSDFGVCTSSAVGTHGLVPAPAANTMNYVLTANGWASSLAVNTSGTASNVTGTVAIAHGGTGATTASGARTNLGIADLYTWYTTELGDTDTKINKWKEVENFLSTVTDSDTLATILSKYVSLDTTLTITGSKTFSNAINGDLLGNATTSDRLKNARTITIGNKSNTFDGSGNISFTLAQIGAQASGNYKTTQTAVDTIGASTNTLTFINSISLDTNGVITATTGVVRDASDSQAGVVSTGALTFAGNKTIKGSLTVSNNTDYSGATVYGALNAKAKAGQKNVLEGNDLASALVVKRTDGANWSVITYENTAGILGYLGFNASSVPIYRTSSGTDYNLLHSNNSSVALSGSTLTVKINGTSQSLTNTDTKVKLTATDNTATDRYLPFSTTLSSVTSGSTYELYYKSNYKYNPSTNLLSVPNIAISGTGNIDSLTAGNLTVSGASTLTGDVSLGTVKSGTWNGTKIADSYISSAATWNAKVSANNATHYIKVGDATTNTACSDNFTANASSNVTTYIPLATLATKASGAADNSGVNTFGAIKGCAEGETGKDAWKKCKVVAGLVYYYNTNTTYTVPATNVIPATTTANLLLLSTSTSGTAKWGGLNDCAKTLLNGSAAKSIAKDTWTTLAYCSSTPTASGGTALTNGCYAIYIEDRSSSTGTPNSYAGTFALNSSGTRIDEIALSASMATASDTTAPKRIFVGIKGTELLFACVEASTSADHYLTVKINKII